MNKTIKSVLIVLGLTIVVAAIIFSGMVYITKNATKEPVKVESVELEEKETVEVIEDVPEKDVVLNWNDWKCEPMQSSYWDLLDLSGVWGFMELRCWKLVQPIEEYCAENPTHCQN